MDGNARSIDSSVHRACGTAQFPAQFAAGIDAISLPKVPLTLPISSRFAHSPGAGYKLHKRRDIARIVDAGENLVVVAVLDLVLHVVVDDAGVDGEQGEILLAQLLVDCLEIGGL